MTTEALSYAIDEHDHLIRVDEGYYRFAEENGWPDAGSSLGRTLWDYVSGRELVKRGRPQIRKPMVVLKGICERLSVRVGSRVTLICGAHRSHRTGDVAYAKNEDTQEVSVIKYPRGRYDRGSPGGRSC